MKIMPAFLGNIRNALKLKIDTFCQQKIIVLYLTHRDLLPAAGFQTYEIPKFCPTLFPTDFSPLSELSPFGKMILKITFPDFCKQTLWALCRKNRFYCC